MADRQPTNEPIEEQVETVPLEDEDGEYVIRQENVGPESGMEGGGEWPDPAEPPRGPAPG